MNRLAHIRPITFVGILAALTVVAAACGSSSSSGSTATVSSGGAMPAAGSTSVAGKRVDVTLKNYSITVVGKPHLAPGTYTFHVTNQGPSSHNLTVNGPGVVNKATPTFPPGTQNLTVTLKNGTYELYCSVPGHKQLGMDTHITVGSGGSSGGSSTGGGSAGGSSSGGSSGSGGGWA